VSASRDGVPVAVHVEFRGALTAGGEEAFVAFAGSAAGHAGAPGLVLEAFVADRVSGSLAGFAVWDGDASAADFYASEEWAWSIDELGVAPTFRYLEVGSLVLFGGHVTPADAVSLVA
jgi:ribosomal protein S18 acetylase RimI-like enzyme